MGVLETADSSIPVMPDQILQHMCMNKPKVSNIKSCLPTIKWPAHFEFRCQMPQGTKITTEQKAETQYLTLYSKKDRIPVFSAYQADPFDTKTGDTKPPIGQSGHVVQIQRKDKMESLTKDNGGRKDWEEAKSDKGPKQTDYEIADEYDRGHLFPLQFASDPMQGKSTFKLTNAVPQDFIFNRNQWVRAETMLKNTFVFDCQDHGYTPIIFTGAVPDYWGLQETELQNLISPKLKIGQKQPVEYTKTWDTPMFKEMKSEGRITVPTHMWSAFMCTGIDNKIVKHLAYIGMNVQVGVVKWYNDPVIFQNTLKQMYRIEETGPFFPPTVSFPGKESAEQKAITALLKKAVEKSEATSVRYQTFLPNSIKYLLPSDLEKFKDKEDDEHWWDQSYMDMFEVRNRIKKQKFDVLAKQLGVDLTMVQLGADFENLDIEDSDDMSTDNQPQTKKRKLVNEEKKRKKRSIQHSVETKFALIEMVDASPISNITLSQCTFEEIYDGGNEQHIINFKDNVFVENKDTTGDDLKVSLVKNGKNIEMPSMPSSSRYINIVLKPRDL